MAFRVDIIPQALADLNALYLRIRQDAPDNADRWLIGFAEAIYSLEDMPGRCMIAEESKDLEQEVRLLLYGRRSRAYKVYFSIHHETETVRIFHVRHWARKSLRSDELQELTDEILDQEAEE